MSTHFRPRVSDVPISPQTPDSSRSTIRHVTPSPESLAEAKRLGFGVALSHSVPRRPQSAGGVAYGGFGHETSDIKINEEHQRDQHRKRHLQEQDLQPGNSDHDHHQDDVFNSTPTTPSARPKSKIPRLRSSLHGRSSPFKRASSPLKRRLSTPTRLPSAQLQPHVAQASVLGAPAQHTTCSNTRPETPTPIPPAQQGDQYSCLHAASSQDQLVQDQAQESEKELENEIAGKHQKYGKGKGKERQKEQGTSTAESKVFTNYSGGGTGPGMGRFSPPPLPHTTMSDTQPLQPIAQSPKIFQLSSSFQAHPQQQAQLHSQPRSNSNSPPPPTSSSSTAPPRTRTRSHSASSPPHRNVSLSNRSLRSTTSQRSIFSTPGRDEMERKKGDMNGVAGVGDDDGPFSRATSVKDLEARRRVLSGEKDGAGGGTATGVRLRVDEKERVEREREKERGGLCRCVVM